MKKINFLFIHSSHDILILHSLFLKKLIKKKETKIFIYNTCDDNIKFMFSKFENIIYLESKQFLKKIKFFKIINREIRKYKINHEINFFASDYLNFISNYFLRLPYVKKHLMSHGTANYMDIKSNTENHKYYYRKSKYILILFRIINKIYYRFKQSLVLLFCLKIYDPFFLHTSGSDRINYDFGYFYSLKNLYTKTKNDILLNIPETDLVDIPNENFILFLDNINAPSYNDDKVRKMITEKINLIKCDTLIHKSHLNLYGKDIKKINTSKKVIYADPRIPAEFYIPHNQNIYVIGSETSVLIYAKIINKNNKVICFDNLFNVDENYRKLYLDYSVEIIDVN